MRDYGLIDETIFDYEKYDADRKAASEIGEEISFTELYLNTEDRIIS